MKAGHGKINEICFAAEGLSGAAAAASLRKLGRLMEVAPSGRLFNAIATLSETSSRAGIALEAGGASLARADEARSELERHIRGVQAAADERLESPWLIEIATPEHRTTLLPHGLPFHRKPSLHSPQYAFYRRHSIQRQALLQRLVQAMVRPPHSVRRH